MFSLITAAGGGFSCRRFGDRRAESDHPTTGAALAELAVGHLSHPAWLVREAATPIVTRALLAANEEVAKALERFAQPGASDDALERARPLPRGSESPRRICCSRLSPPRSKTSWQATRAK